MTKNEIIEAAFKVWGRDFYRKTSLSRLAKELGVSKPALYRHFLNKHALIDAMSEHFYDDFAAHIREYYERAEKQNDTCNRFLLIVRGTAEFYARNVYALVFTLINHDRYQDRQAVANSLKSRGLNLDFITDTINSEYSFGLAAMRQIFGTLNFFMAQFHIDVKSFDNAASEEEIQNIILIIGGIIERGLDFSVADIDSLDLTALENLAAKEPLKTEQEPLFKAVAEAVAEAGPWDASMDMVAKRMGLSKSSLYSHFKNKRDMILKLFMNEFANIVKSARHGMELSVVPVEQLYLGIYSIAAYLRSRPDLLSALTWVRTRKLDLNRSEKQIELFRLFEDVKIPVMQNRTDEEKRRLSHWILFLIILSLMYDKSKKKQYDNIRLLFRFITLGLRGFTK